MAQDWERSHPVAVERPRTAQQRCRQFRGVPGVRARSCDSLAGLMLTLLETPGLPDPDVQPPTIAEAGDPFAELRVVHLVARLQRGVPVRVRDVVDRLERRLGRLVVLAHGGHRRPRPAPGELAGRLPHGRPASSCARASRVRSWSSRTRPAWARGSCAQAVRLTAVCTERLRAFAVEEGAIP